MKNESRKILCFLDKDNPPEHSFVDGMLSSKTLNAKGIKTYLLVSSLKTEKPYRYKKAVCLPIFNPRRGFKRFINYFIAAKFIKYFLKKNHRKTVSFFVRNEPIYLLAASQNKKKHQKLVYQQSFPHEKFRASFFKKIIAKFLIKINSQKADGITAVSPLGLERLKKYFSPNIRSLVVPLLNDNVVDTTINEEKFDNPDCIKFVYIGSHDEERELNIVIEGISQAVNKGVNAKFEFIGAKQEDIIRLSSNKTTENLVKSNLLTFMPKLPRAEVIQKLTTYHVGICLIPPSEIYLESSPTKLTEYMGAGIAILANQEIPLQCKFVSESNSGILVEWSSESISDGIINISKSHKVIENMSRQGLLYARDKLNYRAYENDFLNLFT